MFEKDAEEIAKDIYIHHFDDDVNYPDVLKAITVGVQKGAEFGYNKANEWHDLRKDPNDLPDDTYDVLDQAGYKVHYNFFQNVWMNEKDEIDEHVIAWCEIPTFDKEIDK